MIKMPELTKQDLKIVFDEVMRSEWCTEKRKEDTKEARKVRQLFTDWLKVKDISVLRMLDCLQMTGMFEIVKK